MQRLRHKYKHKKHIFSKMKLTSTFLNQLRFHFEKHFIQNPKVKSYTMEALGHKGDKRFGYSEPFQLLDEEATTYIRKLTENKEFVKRTKYVTSFSPFVLRYIFGIF